MTRTSKHILKYQTQVKSKWLEKLYDDFLSEVQRYVDDICSGKITLQRLMSTKDLESDVFDHSIWRSIAYKQASEIVRSQSRQAKNRRFKRYKKVYSYFMKKNRMKWFIDKKFRELILKPIHLSRYFSKPKIGNISIEINQLLNDSQNGFFFDEFLRLRLPYFQKKKRGVTVNLPIKWHKHSLKFKNWERAKTVRLSKINGNFYINFIYKKDKPKVREEGSTIGIDQGYRKLLTTSRGEFIGDLTPLYEKTARKRQGSKAFKRTLIERNQKVNYLINNLVLDTVREVVIEDLKNVKKKSKFHHKVNNKLQRWTYPLVISKLERLCEENGILLTKVNPAYTSQRCSICGQIGIRRAEVFQCHDCGSEMDADLNAAFNLSLMGAYPPHSPER